MGAHVGATYEAIRKSNLRIVEAHLIEPNPASFSKLQERAAAPGKGKAATLHNIALGASQGVVQMRAADTMTKVVVTQSKERGQTPEQGMFDVPLMSLDVLSDNFMRRHISLLKIDVEGFEEQVLNGASDLLKSEAIDVIYAEAGFNPDNKQQCYYRKIEDILAGYGYRVFRIYEQKNEWLDDSPVLRRVNMAFMSRRFTVENPLRLTNELFDARRRIEEREHDMQALQAMNRKLSADLSAVEKDCEALIAYGSEINERYTSVLNSTSWRVVGPFRVVMRKAKSLLHGKRYGPNRVPKMPRLSDQAIARSGAKSKSRRLGGPSLSKARIKPRTTLGFVDRIARIAKEYLPPWGMSSLALISAKGSVKKALDTAAARLVRGDNADPLQMLLAARPRGEEALKREYREKGLHTKPDSFVLYRIIGNDLYPRHKKGQSRENVRFLLENEPELTACDKRWVVNRMVDPAEERQIIAMLEEHGQRFIHIPFVTEEYRGIGWDFDVLPTPGFLSSEEFKKLAPLERDRLLLALYRLKNNYVMNNNGARNVALRDGRERAKWILPWDGNCFVTARAWQQISQAVTERPHLKFFAVPMERITENTALLRDDFTPHPVEEPQLMFRCDAEEEFNESFPYGRRSKVELLWRLGIPGPWDRWKDAPWDQKRRELSPQAQQFGVAGWVGRLFSGMPNLEARGRSGGSSRDRVRQDAIISMLDSLDIAVGVRKHEAFSNSFKKGSR